MRLKYQLFLTLLVASALLIAAMFLASTWTFSRGLLDYVNQGEIQRLEPLIQDLSDQYSEQQSWQWAVADDKQWHALIRANKPEAGSSQDADNRDPIANGKVLGDGAKRPRDKENNRASRQSGGRPSNAPPKRHPNRLPKLVLADASKRILRGQVPAQGQLTWLPIAYSDETVGYLGFVKLSRLSSQFDQAFELQQRKSIAWAALFMIVLCAVLSVPLTNRLVRPLLKLKKTVEKISQGDFEQRVALSRKDELGALAAGINTLAFSMEQNRDARRRWIAEVSHELRTPVAILRGELEALQDGVRSLDQAAVLSLHTEVMALNRLVDDLHTLSLSDIGALEYQFQEYCVAQVVDQFFSQQDLAMPSSKLQVFIDHHDEKLEVKLDHGRIQQLLANLFQNSQRYTDAGGTLNVTTRAYDHQGIQHVLLEWSDSAPGVSDTALSKLFDPLYREESSRSRELGGAGLGLAISKRIVEGHGGSIMATHSSSGGLCIRILIPCRQEAPQ